MANIIDLGLLPAHNHEYGINHKYIAKELTSSNWKSKAIVRASIYIYVTKGTFKGHKSNSEKCIYVVRGKGIEDVIFDTLNEAIFYSNNYSDYEGAYPKEEPPCWTIHIGPVMKFSNSTNKKKKEKIK